jgi:hypothetical protein
MKLKYISEAVVRLDCFIKWHISFYCIVISSMTGALTDADACRTYPRRLPSLDRVGGE